MCPRWVSTMHTHPTRLLSCAQVSHRMHYLFEQVAEDFEGEGAAANKKHRTPTAATKHLIETTETEQIHNLIESECALFSEMNGSAAGKMNELPTWQFWKLMA